MLEFPQGGERLVGLTNVRAMRDAYPSALTMTIQRIRGSGELWVAENVITYDGKPMHTVNILEFRDGKVARATIFFGDPWDPPAWRAVDRVGRVKRPPLSPSPLERSAPLSPYSSSASTIAAMICSGGGAPVAR